MSLQDTKSDAKVMPSFMSEFGKTDIRYWKERVYRRKRDGGEDSHWTAQIQHLGRREQFPLKTANKQAAAATARDIYLCLHAHGWEKTLALHKPKIEEAKPDESTVGDLIREVAAHTSYRMSTFSVYCIALRSIAASIGKVKASPSRFAPNGAGNKEWRAQVDALPLGMLTFDRIEKWKRDYINQFKDSPTKKSRATNTVNAHISNARSLFTEDALESARARLALPDPLPFAGVKLESRLKSPRYSSRIDPSALILAAKTDLGDVPERREQFKIFCLGLLCGLRKREIDTLLWSSIDFEKAIIRIEQTEYFQPKTEDSASEVDLSPELHELFLGFKATAKGEFVIESPNPPRYHTSRANYRAEADFRALYLWLEGKGVSARKKLHELRKECGSVIANSLGIFAASRALRHSDIRITSQYYSDKKVPITTGLDSLLTNHPEKEPSSPEPQNAPSAAVAKSKMPPTTNLT